MDGFLYDDGEDDEQDVNFYCRFDRQRSSDEIHLSDNEVDEIMMTLEEPEPQAFSPEQEKIFNIKLKKVNKCKRKFFNYIEEHLVIEFNSQKYDISLIRPYLASSLLRLDSTPKIIIKRNNGYMCIRTQKLYFLDMKNYLGHSLRQFYESQQVTTPRGYFPYHVFHFLSCFG